MFRWCHSFLVLLIFLFQVEQAICMPNHSAYLFAYFTGEGLQNGEQVYFALSEANDPLEWRALKGGHPVLVSNVGTKGVRDPYLIRSYDGSKFWLLATDLKMYKSGMSWDTSQRQGSKSILIWESSNLLDWQGPRLVKIAPDTAGNTWAPKAIYDSSSNEYHVFWASSLYPAGNSNHNGSTYHRIMRATTKDFITFSPATVHIDSGHSVIDAGVVYDESSSKFYRFSKDERSNGVGEGKSVDGKFIVQEVSDGVTGKWTDVKVGIGKGSIKQGEGPLVFKNNLQNDKWHLFIDEFGGRGYVPFETTDIYRASWKPSNNFTLPKPCRHGSVIPITEEKRKFIAS
ncbi:Arabinanase/levansucrase/invertase, partial [Microthyrium microscopicum]